MLLSVLLKSLSLLFAVLKLRLFSDKRMKRILTVDKISCGFQYLLNDKEVGNIRYNLAEGYFVVFTWPSSFSALRKIQELTRLLVFASKIVKSEFV